MIKELRVEEKKFEYPIFLFEYLHSYLFRFAIKHKLYTGGTILIIPPELLFEAITTIENGLRDLLDNLYVEPSLKKRSKFGSRYRKILFEGKVYTVDFRTDPVGNTAYGIQVLLSWLRSMMENIGVNAED